MPGSGADPEGETFGLPRRPEADSADLRAMTENTNSAYTWIVTRDAILGDSSDAVGKIGPRGARNRERFDKIIIHGDHFRLLNDAGEVQFTGYILGDYQGLEPLEDYGRSNGCTRIEYERDGAWHGVEA